MTTLPEPLIQAMHQSRLLILWGVLPFPLASRIPADRRYATLSEIIERPTGGAEDLPSLPPLPILSLDASDQVEQAFATAGVPLQVVGSRHDVAAQGCHSLLKLAGDLATRRGVVLSRAEVRDLQTDADKRHLLGEARHAAGGALLLVGCDPADDDFRAWWAVLAPIFRGAALFAVGEPSALWPEAVACLGPDLAVVNAALWAALPLPQPRGPQALTWLHLSDLHFRKETSYDANIVLHALLDDIDERYADDGLRPAFIVVTGDIAFAGQPTEYDMARQFFDDLLRATGLGKDRLFLVPGNHDVNQKRISRGAQGMAVSLTDRESANEVLANDADRGLMMSRFAGYRQLVNDYLGEHLAFDDARYFYVRTLDVGERRIALLGLNSAWLAHGGAKDRGNLLLGERQTRATLAQAEGADLKIALFHHPFDWLREFDRGDSEVLLTDNCDFVLHGHMHQVGLLQARGPDSNAFLIAAGACYETRKHPNAYNFVQLDLGTGQGAVHLRTYSDKRGGFWTKDVMNYRNVPDGVYRFALAERVPPSRAASRGQTARADRGRAAATGRGVAQTGSGSIAITGDVQGDVTIVRGGVQSPYRAPAADAAIYNLAAIHDLLLAAFTAQDLRRLFLYTSNAELRPLIQEFSPGDGLAAMVDKTIEFCQVRGLLPDLLRVVEQANPRRYASFAQRLRGK